jgi:hypothetical protein
MPFVAIVVMSVIAAVTYGILHDQITARICVEYFTLGHPPIFGTDDPTLLGIGWGIIATWWVGFLLGVPLAIVARVGPRPKRDAISLIKPMAGLLLITGCGAIIAGIVGGVLASTGAVFLVGPIARAVPQDRHVPFLIDLWVHNASYLFGGVGGIVLIVKTWRSRHRVDASGQVSDRVSG